MDRDIYKKINYIYIFTYLTVLNFVYFIAPILFRGKLDILIALSFLGLFSNPLWLLIHEATHGVLFDKEKNDFWGRILSIYFGAPFRILQGGHLLHHGYNRTKEEVTDLYNPQTTSKIIANFKYYFWILQGLYLSEILSNFIFLVPTRILHKLKNYYKERSSLKYNMISFIILREKEAKIDGFLITLFYGIAFYLYGQNAYILILFFIFRGFMISIFDNVYHYGTKENNILFGYNLTISPVLKYYFLNSNYHGFHHEKPKIPWYKLSKEFHKLQRKFDGSLFPQLFRQLRGAIPNTRL